MSKVTFTIPGDIPSDLAAQVPVNVLDHELLKAAAGRAGAEFDLQAGLYAARAMLPDGRELGVAFRVEGGGPQLQLDMSYVGGPASPREGFPSLGAVALDEPTSPDPPRPRNWPFAPSAPAGFQVRVVSGNPFLGPQRTEPWVAIDPEHPFSVLGRSEVQAVEVPSQDPIHERHVMAPVQPGEHRRVTFGADGGGGVVAHMTFDDPELELLVRYLGAGMLSSATDMARSDDGLARRALREGRRPMGATLGAYVLLQASGPRAVAEFVEDLPERFPWLPDARVLRAEVFARQGRHLDALSDLMALRNAGPPIFSSGLSYALNRMRQYTLRGDKQRLPVDVLLFKPFAAQLDWLAARTDFDRPILTYRPPAAPTLTSVTANAVQTTLRSASGLLDGFRRRPEPSD